MARHFSNLNLFIENCTLKDVVLCYWHPDVMWLFVAHLYGAMIFRNNEKSANMQNDKF